MILISTCYGCSYASGFDLWAAPMGECYTDDETPAGSYILSCNGTSDASLMTYSNSDCSGTGTPFGEDIEYDTLVCAGTASCNIGRISSYRTLNDTNCNDRNKYEYSTPFVINKCIPTAGGFGDKKAGYASCDSLTNTITLKWYFDVNCQNMASQRDYTSQCVHNADTNFYEYTEIQCECGSSTDATCTNPPTSTPTRNPTSNPTNNPTMADISSTSTNLTSASLWLGSHWVVYSLCAFVIAFTSCR